MATFAPHETETLLAELETRTREAWAAYSGSVQGMEGRSYETAEAEAWEELQLQLRAIDADRIDLVDLRT
jgi:hypothetical protein